MNKYNILLICLLLIQSIVGCSDDFTPAQVEEKIDLRIKACLSSDNHSKAETHLVEGSTLGLFINEISKSYDNINYAIRKVIENSKYLTINNTIVGDPISLSKEKLYRVFGYSPFANNFSSRTGIVQYEHNTDILWTETYFPNQNIANVVNEMPLKFSHLTSQVIFKIEDNRDFSSKEKFPIENLRMKISGFPKHLYLDVNNGFLIPGEIDSSIVIDKIDEPYFIAPTYHSEYSKLNISISIENFDHSIDLSQLFNKPFFYRFLPNHSYTLKILLNTYSISYSATINQWDYREADELVILNN